MCTVFGSFSDTSTKYVKLWFRGYPQVSTESVFAISDNMSYNKFRNSPNHVAKRVIGVRHAA